MRNESFSSAPARRFGQRAVLKTTVLIVGAVLFGPLVCSSAVGRPATVQIASTDERAAELSEAQTLMSEAEKFHRERRYDEALQLAERALAIRKKLLGDNHIEVARSLEQKSRIYLEIGDFVQSERFLKQALETTEGALGTDHPDVAVLLNSLTLFYREIGNFARAVPLCRRALAIREKLFGNESYEVAVSLGNLAMMHVHLGDYDRAEPLYRRAVTILENVLGKDHRDVAILLQNFATLYYFKGDFEKAEVLYRRALEVKEKTVGPEHWAVAAVLSPLAVVHRNKGDFIEAERLCRRALAIREKAFGGEHRDVAVSLANLATLYLLQKEYAKAEPLYRRALAIQEKVFGGNHPNVATMSCNLAEMFLLKGDYEEAEKLSRQALAVLEKTLRDGHRETANTLRFLARLFWIQGNLAEAIAFRIRGNDVREHTFTGNLTTGSERQKLLYLNLSAREHDETLSLHLLSAPNDTALGRAALTSILRSKGRALDAMTAGFDALRRQASSEDTELLAELTRAKSKLAVLALRGPGPEGPTNHQARIRELETAIDDLEAKIGLRVAETRDRVVAPVTLEAVQRAIPSDAVLIEFSTYRPYSPKTGEFGKRRYGTYLLKSTGEPKWADLGEAESVDRLVAEFRRTLQSPGTHRKLVHRPSEQSAAESLRATNERARRLHAAVFKPLEPYLGAASRLFVSPDGTLNLVPFAALVDDGGTYLVERYGLTYLTSGRDLLRLKNETPPAGRPLVFADPDYGEGTGPFLLGHQYEPLRRLKGTAEEGRQIGKLLPDADLKTRLEATKRNLETVRGPIILHIATHGCFLDDTPAETVLDAEQRRLTHGGDSPPIDVEQVRRANPLLRSYLFFAGANKNDDDFERGTLTALEAAGLDLWGTKLVVLSACDTGVGDVRNGEGVYGLRRALVLAGSETQVMSLWSVSDAATRGFMVRYYQGLKRGEGRADALRAVQLDALRDPKRRHPYFWAGFIQSGEWANLDGHR